MCLNFLRFSGPCDVSREHVVRGRRERDDTEWNKAKTVSENQVRILWRLLLLATVVLQTRKQSSQVKSSFDHSLNDIITTQVLTQEGCLKIAIR